MNGRWRSWVAWLAIMLVLLVLGLNRTRGNPRAVIWSDAEGYYKYLPGLFLLGDFHQLQPGSIWPYYNDKGEYVNKYACGIAYFQLPFFALALAEHAVRALPVDDHYDPVFARWMAISGIFYAWLGLLVLFSVLRRAFSIRISAWTVAAVFFGTNLFHYATKEMGISHVYSFFLFSSLLYVLPGFLRKPHWGNSLLLGAILGCITLIRPTNIITALLLAGYDVYTWPALKERLRWLMNNASVLLLAVGAAALMWVPQLMYWREMTGQWIYYSYTEETFKYWRTPKIAAVLLDVQNGLFLYSPMALLMVAGVFMGIRFRKYHGPVLLLLLAIATYLFASWWAWWFGGAFGHRCYVEYYALLALPLSGLFQVTATKPRGIRIAFFGLVSALMIYSVRLSYLYTSIGGPWDGPDWRWNWEKYAWIMSHFFEV